MSDLKLGAFLGLAVGDCLGAPVEGMPAWEIQRRFGRVTTVLDPFEVWIRRPERGRLAGLHTDDTQQAWMVASVLLEHREIVPSELAERFVAFARPLPDLPRGLHRGTGRMFRTAVERLAAGTPALEAGVLSAGNGAAMRSAPAGIVFGADLDAVVRATLLAGAVTHHDPRGLEAAAALAALVGALVSDAPPRDFRTCRPERRIKRGTEGFACASVAASIALASRAASFREVLEDVVNAGEDTDTTGAMAGAIAGARFGRAAIPDEWLATLVGRSELERVAAALAGEGPGAPQQMPLEEGWCRLEVAEARRRRDDGAARA
ncbi:MAG: ADP-ribosylglycohydrolase family protein [Candidatus Riflebacteria bacterium]|nr:ADP-ribosylglycohydrolase family protein [Candidatus Riflebacteria bacterium]